MWPLEAPDPQVGSRDCEEPLSYIFTVQFFPFTNLYILVIFCICYHSKWTEETLNMFTWDTNMKTITLSYSYQAHGNMDIIWLKHIHGYIYVLISAPHLNLIIVYSEYELQVKLSPKKMFPWQRLI